MTGALAGGRSQGRARCVLGGSQLAKLNSVNPTAMKRWLGLALLATASGRRPAAAQTPMPNDSIHAAKTLFTSAISKESP